MARPELRDWPRRLILCAMLLFATATLADEYSDAQLAIRTRDYQHAYTLLVKLARHGHADAQYQLAAMYRSGRGIKKDHDKAAVWYHKAARQGHVKAQYNLGVLHENGWGVTRNELQAMHWYRLAAAQGHKKALLKIESGGQAPRPVTGTAATKQLHRAALKGDNRTLRALIDQGVNIDVRDPYQATSLMIAAEQGHAATVDLLLKAGADVNAQEGYGDTALLKAAAAGQATSVSKLLHQGAGVNQADRQGNTPLMLAVRANHTATVSTLLKEGAAVNSSNRKGDTALEIAERNSYPELAKRLRLAGARRVEKPVANAGNDRQRVKQAAQERGKGDVPLIVEAAWRGQREVVQVLLSQGTNVETRDAEGFTSLARAAWHGHEAVVQDLIAAGADVNAGSRDGETPLLLAAKYGHERVAHQLLIAGAKDSANVNGVSALGSAIQQGHSGIVRLLLDQGGNAAAARNGDNHPLIAATRNGDLVTAKVLLKHHACLDCADTNGRTPLWYAVDQGHSELVNFFLASTTTNARALVQQVDKDDYTALHRAALKGDAGVISLLLKHGANVDARAAGTNSPLLLAAREGHQQAVKRLLLAGASVDAKNAQGNTALMLAAGNGSSSVVKVLLEYNANPSLRNQHREQAFDIASKAKYPEIASLLKDNAPGFW